MNKVKLSVFGLSLLTLSIAIYSCSKSEEDVPVTTTNEGAVSVTSVVQSKYTSAVTISTSGSSIILKSKGTPDHVTPYWGVGNALYEAPTKEATSLGPIGMALNGVAIYNDREGGNLPVDAATLLSFDRGGAHSGPGGLYHYHFTGDWIGNDDAKLIGFVRDGYPIYARKDKDGSYPSNLDAYGGHTGATTEFPNGIYHYHAANTAYLGGRFYVLKSGSYYGTKGTFTF